MAATALGACGGEEESFEPGACQSELVGNWKHTRTQVDEAPFLAALQLLGQVPVCQDLYQGPVVNEKKFNEHFTTSCAWQQTGNLSVGFNANISSTCLQLVAQQDANPLSCALLPLTLASFLGSNAPPGTCHAVTDACACTFLSAQLGKTSGSYSVDGHELTLETSADAGTPSAEPIVFSIKGNEMTWQMTYGQTHFERQ